MLWNTCRGGDTQFDRLPCAGGTGDQPAWLMDAFSYLTQLAKKLEPDA